MLTMGSQNIGAVFHAVHCKYEHVGWCISWAPYKKNCCQKLIGDIFNCTVWWCRYSKQFLAVVLHGTAASCSPCEDGARQGRQPHELLCLEGRRRELTHRVVADGFMAVHYRGTKCGGNNATTWGQRQKSIIQIGRGWALRGDQRVTSAVALLPSINRSTVRCTAMTNHTGSVSSRPGQERVRRTSPGKRCAYSEP